MKSTGIVRKIDKLGRIVIPKEMRQVLNMGDYDELEIGIEGNKIFIQKQNTGCVVCNEMENLSEIKEDKYMCITCISEISLRK